MHCILYDFAMPSGNPFPIRDVGQSGRALGATFRQFVLPCDGGSGMNNAMLTFFKNNGLRRAMMLAVPVMVLIGCDTTPGAKRPGVEQAHPEAAVAPERIINYICDDGRTIEVTLNGPERAELKINGATARLTGVRSASGAKFQSADGSITFWSKGNEATIDTVTSKDRQTHMVCTLRP